MKAFDWWSNYLDWTGRGVVSGVMMDQASPGPQSSWSWRRSHVTRNEGDIMEWAIYWIDIVYSSMVLYPINCWWIISFARVLIDLLEDDGREQGYWRRRKSCTEQHTIQPSLSPSSQFWFVIAAPLTSLHSDKNILLIEGRISEWMSDTK